MNEKIIMQNPELCPHGNQIGMCDVCGGEKKEKNIETSEGLIKRADLARELGVSRGVVVRREKKYVKEFSKGVKMMGKTAYLTLPLAQKIRKEFAIEIPENAVMQIDLAREFDIGASTLSNYVKKHEKDFLKSVIEKRGKKYIKSPLIQKIREEYVIEIPENAVTQIDLAKELNVNKGTIANHVKKHEKDFPGSIIKRGRSVHYTEEFANKIREELNIKIPANAITQVALVKELEISASIISRYVEKHEQDFPGSSIKRGRNVHYTEEFANKIREDLNIHNIKKLEREQKNILKADLENELIKIKNESDDIQIKKVISLFDGAQAVDILFHFRPEFKGLPVEYVKSKLAEYLGDFMVERKPLNLDDLGAHVEMLSVATFRDSMLEVMKRDCLLFYNEQKRNDNTKNEREIFDGYIEYMIEKVGDMKSEELDNIIEGVEEYYDEVLQQQKPDNIVSSLREGRVFPDINQMINIKEIADKKRMLIADEMGLGKSASAILTKEYLGCACALIAVPSNVVSTWEEYLASDVDNETGKQKGYFKEGLEPRVLTINSQEDIEKMQEGVWDYVIVSHEKLNDIYMEALSELGNDMLIVDEVHKMKNTKGVRAKNVQILSEQIEGDNQYLSILSGTPVPNKVDDLAMTLRLLYPEEFGVEKIDNKTLVQNIINGDLLDLRNVLVPRMQMKRLEESIEMPELRENISYIEMSQEQKDIYEVLMEEDEVTASQKMQVLRQFLLNPALLDSTPNITSPKIEAFTNSLEKSFETKDKVVVFVNSYVEGVIRGKNGIQEQLGERLSGVEIYSVHGKDNEESELNKKEYRSMIKEKINNSDGKVLLLVSGSVADVGVDFSGGEEVYFYNEPWTMYDKRQQLGRVFREGISNDLDVRTSVVKDSIEEGMYNYIRTKEKAIEKLLRGVPIANLEKELLKQNEKQPDLSKGVNEEIAEYYFSAWDKLLKFFGSVKEIGEKDFREFLEDHGTEYAECYTDLEARSYQANASRINANVMDAIVKENNLKADEIKILDIASGPEMLKNHIQEKYQDKVFSIDINKHHFKHKGDKRVVGSFSKLPIQEQSMDFVNFSFAAHYSKMLISENNFERLETFSEINRVLKVGGKAVINFIYSMDFKNQELFLENVKKMGFDIVSEYTGDVDGGNSYQSFMLTLQKTKDFDEDVADFVDEIGAENTKGFKFVRSKEKKLKDSRMILKDVLLNGEKLSIAFNQKDSEIFAEEQYILKQAEILKGNDEIENINPQEIIDKKFVRVYNGKRYILFKKLKAGNGAVVIR